MMPKIGIICANDEERNPFLSHIEHTVVTEKAMLQFYEGYLDHVPIIVLYCGVCKVNAAIAAQILIDTYCVDMIISAGTAGAIDNRVKLFDTVISTQVAYYDVADDILTEFHPWLSTIYFETDAELLEIAEVICYANNNVYMGRIVTGEQFIEEEQRKRIKEKYNPLSVDMESASIAHVCYVNKIPFISIRTITDDATHTGINQFDKNCKQASKITKNIVLEFVQEMNKRNNIFE